MSSQLYKKAPLAIVLGQVVHSPVAKIGEYIADIQDRIRKCGFPEFYERTSSNMEVRLDPDGGIVKSERETKSWEFASADRGKVAIVNGNSVGLMCSPKGYKGNESYLTQLADLTGIVSEIVQVDLIRRIGLRYIDHIKPYDNESLIDYLSQSVVPIATPLKAKVSKHHSHTELITDEGERVSVSLRHGKSQLVITPDLSSAALDVDYEVKTDGKSAVLDIDAVREFDPFEALEMETLNERLKALHRIHRILFEGLATNTAMSNWKG